ncbi:uncharacterized protein SCHCODRAFT_02524062 [Schizophyllum commune H4-8]|uniref:Uncharacterized protein n=1 Tax=Schizophyllum commune (strain H4-8 / FGSC 9210) TaxID=578458 RepID=D8PT12_SCHCM|nr:uncharacterized protein SCHCODRAFT_02524062 [Schizophyllum commune H4-8]KAI5899472.1 hypothetical protein SCHCODRAFT_02524062 [Schizophyllum commune H4-8]
MPSVEVDMQGVSPWVAYTSIALAVVSIFAMVLYLLSPPNLLKICGHGQTMTHARLSNVPEECSIPSNRPSTLDVPTLVELHESLAKLDERKHELEGAVWGQRRNPIARMLPTIPFSVAAIRLWWGYYSLEKDVRVFSHHHRLPIDDQHAEATASTSAAPVAVPNAIAATFGIGDG